MTTNYPNGANRDGRAGKVSYRCRNPIVELSFAKYMDKCTYLANGERREPDNWMKGMDLTHDLDSLLRHVADLEALHHGYRVFKVKRDDVERTIYSNELVTSEQKDIEVIEVDREDTVNAIRFNCGVYLLDYLHGQKGI